MIFDNKFSILIILASKSGSQKNWFCYRDFIYFPFPRENQFREMHTRKRTSGDRVVLFISFTFNSCVIEKPVIAWSDCKLWLSVLANSALRFPAIPSESRSCTVRPLRRSSQVTNRQTFFGSSFLFGPVVRTRLLGLLVTFAVIRGGLLTYPRFICRTPRNIRPGSARRSREGVSGISPENGLNYSDPECPLREWSVASSNSHNRLRLTSHPAGTSNRISSHYSTSLYSSSRRHPLKTGHKIHNYNTSPYTRQGLSFSQQ